MGAITPQFMMDLESRMQVLTESEYSRMQANLWWQSVAKVRQSGGRREVLSWLLSTAMIRDQGAGGNVRFDDLVSVTTEVENKDSGTALKLAKNQLEDMDGNGMDLARQWSTDIGHYMAYWPQKQVTHFLKNAHNLVAAGGYTGYDSVAYFSASHPLNPYKTALGNYANIFTGAASGSYPGACPIDAGVDDDDALVNLSKIFAYIATIKMPNGEDPRFLRPKAILCGPQMFPRAVQLTSAKFIAKVAGSGAGSADVERLIAAMGYATPTMCDELAGFESDTTFFVVCEQASTSELGGVVYVDREPYNIDYYGPQTALELQRKREFEWHCHGRNSLLPGHPYLIFKCKGT